MKKILLLCFLFTACARAPLEDPKLAFRPAESLPVLADSFSLETLSEALDRNLTAIRAGGANVPVAYNFGERVIPRADYLLALEAIKPELESMDRLNAFITANFDFYEVYGNEEGWGRVFSTGYYDPVIEGSRRRTASHTQPIYRQPEDLVAIDLIAYGERFPDLEVIQKVKDQKRSARPSWRGRYVPERKTIIPYYPRSEIAEGLAGKKLELAWMDPVDAFFLEIQGSGLVRFSDGTEKRFGYSAQNGYPYVAIGKFLTHIIPLEEMSMQRIRQALAAMSPAERDQVLHQNPSQVFFQELKGKSLTFSGAEVTPMRTIATDQFFFPKGTMGFLEIDLPVFADATALEPAAWDPKPRWIFDQDTGGAIRGGGRVDLYMGQGEEPARQAGVMKRQGKLWMIAPKEEFLARIRPAPPL